MVKRFVILFIFFFLPRPSYAEMEMTSFQSQALAPNAGGQRAFALRRFSDREEWSVFSNQYLKTGDVPLTGGSYALRFSLCGNECIAQIYAQTGFGISTAGPMVELIWGLNLFWLIRVDFATQAYFAGERVIFWSYPVWAGLSVPF